MNVRQQAITWAIVDTELRRRMAPLDHNELIESLTDSDAM